MDLFSFMFLFSIVAVPYALMLVIIYMGGYLNAYLGDVVGGSLKEFLFFPVLFPLLFTFGTPIYAFFALSSIYKDLHQKIASRGFEIVIKENEVYAVNKDKKIAFKRLGRDQWDVGMGVKRDIRSFPHFEKAYVKLRKEKQSHINEQIRTEYFSKVTQSDQKGTPGALSIPKEAQ